MVVLSISISVRAENSKRPMDVLQAACLTPTFTPPPPLFVHTSVFLSLCTSRLVLSMSLVSSYLRLYLPIIFPFSSPSVFLSSILISLFTCLCLVTSPLQDHPAQRHLPPERAQHLLPGQRGRVRHVPQVEGQQGQGQRVHRDHQVQYSSLTREFICSR